MNRIACCELDDFLAAMSDETREQILVLLRDREMSVNELTHHFVVTQPTISHHLTVLRRARLVSTRHDGRQVFHRANPERNEESPSAKAKLDNARYIVVSGVVVSIL